MYIQFGILVLSCQVFSVFSPIICRINPDIFFFVHPLSSLIVMSKSIQLEWPNKAIPNIDRPSKYYQHVVTKSPSLPPKKTIQLFWGDNWDILLHLRAEQQKFHLIYLDPPFCSDANYHQILKNDDTSVQILAYTDTLAPSEYLQFLYHRFIIFREILHDNGSILVHCDNHQSHHIRCLLEEVFGAANFRNEIIWHYTGGGRAKKYFSRKHDNIFWFSKSNSWTFNIDTIRQPYNKNSGYAKSGITAKSGKVYTPHPLGTPIDDTWNIPIINPMSKERVGYPTQKPLELIEKLILACSNEGDSILDPFLGSGTTAVASEKYKRQFTGCDLNINAIHCTMRRTEECAVYSANPFPTILGDITLNIQTEGANTAYHISCSSHTIQEIRILNTQQQITHSSPSNSITVNQNTDIATIQVVDLQGNLGNISWQSIQLL